MLGQTMKPFSRCVDKIATVGTWSVAEAPRYGEMFRPRPEQSSRRIEAGKEMHDVAILHDIIGAFEPHFAGVLRPLLAAAGDEIGVGDRLGADKAFLEIAVDDPGGLRRLGAARDRPGARLLRAGGQERDQVEQRIAFADDAVEPGLAEAERFEEFALFVGIVRDARIRPRSPPRSRPSARPASRRNRRRGGCRGCRSRRSPRRHWRYRGSAWRSAVAAPATRACGRPGSPRDAPACRRAARRAPAP